jgi:hypothetical protein
MISNETHLKIGSLVFDGMDQIDLTGPLAVLSRIPNSTYRLYSKTARAVRDVMGLRLIPDADLAEAPALDVLHIPGGFGQEALMEDEAVLGWIRRQASESVRRLYEGIQSFLSIRRMDARRMNASALWLRFSQSLANRRQRPNQPMVRSTIQRLGRTTKPLARSERRTISVTRFGMMLARPSWNTGPA